MNNLNSLAINEAVNFSDCLIEHQEFRDCYYRIMAVHRTYFTNPRGLMILGEPGVGKSKLAHVYMSDCSNPSTDERTKNTIIIVEMPPSCSIDWFYTKILAALGDPAPESGRIPSKELRVIQLFKAQEVELLIIDEIHNLLPGNVTGAQAQKMANMLKTLMNTTQVPIVLLGEERADALIEVEAAFASRFKKLVYLRNMEFSEDLERQNYREFLASIRKKIEVPCIALDNEDFAIRMYAASAGNIREMMHMVTEAIEYILEGEPSITLDTFACAFEQISSNPMNLKNNPFEVKVNSLYKRLGVTK